MAQNNNNSLQQSAANTQQQAANTQQQSANKQQQSADKNKSASKSLLDSASLIVKAAIKIASIDYEKQLEKLSLTFDTTLTRLEAANRVSQQGIDNIIRGYTNAIHTTISGIMDGVNESAYTAANNMVDLSLSLKKYNIDRGIIEKSRDLDIALREKQFEKTMNNLDAQLITATTTMAGEVIKEVADMANDVSIVGVSLGDAPSEIADAASKMGQIITGVNETVVKYEGEIDTKRMEGIQKIVKFQLESAAKIEKKWLDAAPEVQKAWLQFTQHLENNNIKNESSANTIGINLGLSGNQLDSFKKEMFRVQKSISNNWGKTLEDMQKMQEHYFETTGRNIQMSENDMNETIANSLLYGEETIMQMNAGAEILGVSIENSNDLMFEMYKQANKMGLNAKAYGKTLVQSLKVAEKYQFKDGIKGLASMAKWAAQTRFNMQNLDSMISSIHEGGLQGIIEKSANLQVLGGNFAMNSDPLRMAWESYMNPAGLAKRYNRMLDGIGYLDSNGELVTGVADQMRLEEFAKQTGQSINDVRNQIRQTLRGDSVSKNLNQNINWNEEQKALITNKAFKNENGQWVVKMNEADENGNWERNVSELTAEDLQHLFPENNEEKLTSYVYDIRNMMMKLDSVKVGSQSRLSYDTYDNWVIEENKRMKNVAEDFNLQYEKYISMVKGSMQFATESQKTFEEMMAKGNKEIDDSRKEIVKAGKNIAESLENVSKIINDAIKEIQHVEIPELEGVNKDNIEDLRFKTWAERGNWRNDDFVKLAAELKVKQRDDEEVNRIMNDLVGGSFLNQKEDGMVDNWTKEDVIRAYDYLISHKDKNGHSYVVEGEKDSENIPSVLYNSSDPFDIFTRNLLLYGMPSSYNTLGGQSVKDGLINKNGDSKKIEDGLVIQNGIPTRIDDKDQVIAAKNGGPLDRMLDSVYNIVNGSNVANNTENNFVYEKRWEEILTKTDNVPRPMHYDSYVRESPNSNSGGQGNSNGKIEVAPIQININGSIQLSGANGTMDITQQIANDPNFIRSLSQMISLEVEKKVHGGRVNNVLDRGLQF